MAGFARWSMTISVLVLVLAACGSDGSSSDPTSPNPADPAQPTTTAFEWPEDEDPDDPGGSTTPNPSRDNPSATVVIGETTFEFEPRCQWVFGNLQGGGQNGDISITFEFPPEEWLAGGTDWSPPSIQISRTSGESFRWATGGRAEFAGVDPAEASAISYTLADRTVVGSATFFDLEQLFVSSTEVKAAGTFTFACP